MKQVLCGIAAALLAMECGSAMAQTSTVVSGKTNNGDNLRFYPESVRLENKYWRSFNYDLMQPDGATLSRTATTPWCRKGKIELDSRASSESSADYQKGASWFAIETGTIVYADSVASRNLLAKVCEAVPQPKMQALNTSTPAPFLSDVSVSDTQANSSEIENYKVMQAYLRSVNDRLLEKKNPTITLTDEKKINLGLLVCRQLDNQVALSRIRRAFIDGALENNLTEQQKDYVINYFATVEFYSIYWLCPQHRLQLAEENDK